VFNLKQS